MLPFCFARMKRRHEDWVKAFRHYFMCFLLPRNLQCALPVAVWQPGTVLMLLSVATLGGNIRIISRKTRSRRCFVVIMLSFSNGRRSHSSKRWSHQANGMLSSSSGHDDSLPNTTSPSNTLNTLGLWVRGTLRRFPRPLSLSLPLLFHLHRD